MSTMSDFDFDNNNDDLYSLPPPPPPQNKPQPSLLSTTTTNTTTTAPTNTNQQQSQQQQQPKLTLPKGFLSSLKAKKGRSEYDASTAISDELLVAQQAQSTLTSTDRLIQQQLINKTISMTNDDTNDIIKTGKKGQLVLKGGNKNRNGGHWKLEWDQNELNIDQYSLLSGSINENEQDMNGNFIKKQRINHQRNNHHHHNNNNQNQNQTNINNNTQSTTNTNNNNNNNNDPHQIVSLGMESDELILSSTLTHSHHGDKLQRTSAFNMITNSLGISQNDASHHLQQHALTQRQYQQNFTTTTNNNTTTTATTTTSTTPNNNNNNNNEQNIDLSLLPRNKKLLNADRRHWSEKTLDEMTIHDWTILREDFRIKTTGTNIPNPLRFWKELEYYNVPTGLLDAIKTIGYIKPTGIQRIAMPTSLLNRDIIARAQTGSGKTCSFLIPVLTYISNQPQLNEKTCQDGPYGIILAPARELATQIYDEAIKLSRYLLQINIACVIGGKKEYSLANRIELIIATPGRLDELLEQRELVLNQCRYIILDEADKMLDEGFEPQVKNILSHMPSAQQSNVLVDNIYQDKRRRTMLYSATFSHKVEELAKKYMAPDYVKVEVGDQIYKINPSITQLLEWCPGASSDNKKYELLIRYINNNTMYGKTIIFCARKDNCDYLCRKIIDTATQSRHYYNRQQYNNNNNNNNNDNNTSISKRFNFDVKPIVLHSDAFNREENLRGFKDGDYNVLIATDVAGRGIDVKDVTLVINYELPDVPVLQQQQQQQLQQGQKPRINPNIFNPIFEAYTHRVGRTGRAGNTGTAVTFLTEKEKKMLPFFKSFLQKNGVKHFPAAMNEIAENEFSNKPITL